MKSNHLHRIIVGLLITALLVNSMGHFFVVDSFFHHFKKQLENYVHIEHASDINDGLILPLSYAQKSNPYFKWVDEKHFIYHQQLFEINDMLICNQVIYVDATNKSAEERLLAQAFKSNTQHGPLKTDYANFLNHILSQAIQPQEYSWFILKSESVNYSSHLPKLNSILPEMESPPPEYMAAIPVAEKILFC